MQRIAVASSCVIFWILGNNLIKKENFRFVWLAVLAVLACVEKVFAIMNLICIEKDWVVVIAGSDEDILSGELAPRFHFVPATYMIQG